MSNFRPIDRDTGFLMPQSVDEWLPARHLARFVVEVIAGLDLRAMTGSYRGSGEASYHPQLLLGIIVYGYAPPACFPAASWSGRPTTPWRFASSLPTSIPITTRSPHSGLDAKPAPSLSRTIEAGASLPAMHPYEQRSCRLVRSPAATSKSPMEACSSFAYPAAGLEALSLASW